jgi:hypothetical protein
VNFADTHYVRLYTYDTIGWLMMEWQARATLPLLMRKFDRAGVLDLAEYAGEEMPRAIAAMIGLPEEVVAVGLAELVKRKTLVVRGQYLVMPNFIPAQETLQSDRLRKAEQRKRYRDKAMAVELGLVPAADVTNRDNPSAHTESKPDTASRTGTESPVGVTASHSVHSRAEHSSAVQGPGQTTEPEGDPRTYVAPILRELERHQPLAQVAYQETAQALANRFATIQIQRNAKIEWVITSIRDCAAHVAGLGLKPEALLKKLCGYVDNSRAPKQHANGSGSDAIIESREDPAEMAKAAEAVNARKALQEAQRKMGEKTK